MLKVISFLDHISYKKKKKKKKKKKRPANGCLKTLEIREFFPCLLQQDLVIPPRSAGWKLWMR